MSKGVVAQVYGNKGKSRRKDILTLKQILDVVQFIMNYIGVYREERGRKCVGLIAYTQNCINLIHLSCNCIQWIYLTTYQTPTSCCYQGEYLVTRTQA